MAKSKTISEHPQEIYAEHLARYYSALTPMQRRAEDKISAMKATNLKIFSEKSDKTTAEINEYDRQRFGFFGLAISFIVGGLLSNQIQGPDTLGARVFLMVCIASSLVCIFLLFFEYSVTYCFLKRANDINQEILSYIASNRWRNSEELSENVMACQKKIPTSTPRLIQYLEVIALAISMITLIAWLTEKMFNPHWLFWM